MKTEIEPYLVKYRILEYVPNRYVIERSYATRSFFGNKITGEKWMRPEANIYYLTSYITIELAAKSIEDMIERDEFVPRVVKKYTVEKNES